MYKTLSRNAKRYLSLIFPVYLLLVFSGCGKHETAGGLVGAASGAIIGAAVSSEKDEGTGAVIGALLGSMIGKEIGKEEDEVEEEEERRVEREITEEKINRLNAENSYLRKSHEKHCSNCGRKSKVIGAKRCASCGSSLVKEKFCRRCYRKFDLKDSSYRYCPYHDERVLLSYR